MNSELPYVRTILSFLNSDLEIKSLLDSGATHSFIRLNVLPIFVQQEISQYIKQPSRCINKLKISFMDVIIQTATEESRSLCPLLNINLNLHGWECSHEFIVTNKITKDSVILGYDFIRKYKVDVTNPKDFFTQLCVSS